MSRPRKTLIGALLVLIAGGAGLSTSRLRQPAPSDLRLLLNIPASRLDVYEQGIHTRSFRISAGRREFATPVGSYQVSRVVWNPWWHPPDSEWARDEKPTPPGPDNPMGRVKINFAPLLYIHGTPYEDDLGMPASHGCIRMSNRDLVELARIVHRHRTPRLPARLLETLEANPVMTREFNVRPVPFDVVYRLAEVIGGNLVIHPDVYREAGSNVRAEVVSALERAGIEVNSQVEQRIEAVSKRRLATRLTVAVDSIVNDVSAD